MLRKRKFYLNKCGNGSERNLVLLVMALLQRVHMGFFALPRLLFIHSFLYSTSCVNCWLCAVLGTSDGKINELVFLVSVQVQALCWVLNIGCLCSSSQPDEKYDSSPGWCGSGGVSACKAKRHWFDSGQGTCLGCGARSLVGGVGEATNGCFSHTSSFSPSLSLSKNK